MTTNIELAEPAPISGDAWQVPHQAQEAKRRQHVVTLVMVAAAARTALDRRTLAAVAVLAIALAAAKGMAKERGTPALNWYRRRSEG